MTTQDDDGMPTENDYGVPVEEDDDGMTEEDDDRSPRQVMVDLTIPEGQRSSTLVTTYSLEAEKLYGRTFAPALYGEEHRYYLPIDGEEQCRQELAHAIWLRMRAILPPVQDIPEGLFFDLGTGWGYWAREVSQMRPERDIIGLDIYHQGDAPSNVLNWGGWFLNEEIRLDHWTSNKQTLLYWRKCITRAALHLRLPLHSGPDIATALREAGFPDVRTEMVPFIASWAGNKLGMDLLEFVIQTVKASVRILVEGRICASADVDKFVDQVVIELEEEDCDVHLVMEVLRARKPGASA